MVWHVHLTNRPTDASTSAMKTQTQIRTNKTSLFAALAAAAILAAAPASRAVNYAGNGNTGFGGTIGNGVMSLSDDGTNISGHLTFGGSFNDTLVIYVDTGASGGFNDTTNFNDQGDGTRQAISGVSGSGRSEMAFTNGFSPKYALGISSGFGGLWQLASGGNNSLPFVASVNYNNGAGTFSFPATAIGLTNGQQTTIRIFGTYIASSAYRSTEAIAGNDHSTFGGQGWTPFVQTAYASYTFAQAAVPTYAVKFSVDMTAYAAAGNFVPGTDTVYCGGSFQTNAFAFTDFPLVRSNSSNIYTNTYQDANPTNTVETYKFMFASVAGATNSFDDNPNRAFTLKSGGQVLPLVYFNNVPASPSATTNVINFSIDMGPQIYLGHFNPGAGDVVSVFGSFEQPKWSGNFPPNFMLTNNVTLSGNASNIYSGTFADGNYPGTVNQYKFVIIPFGNTTTNYEDGADRTLVTPTNAGTLPLAYFSGVSTYAAVPITFSVDMTVPIVSGQINLANGDTVGCAGTFQTNSFGVGPSGFTLTNNPALSGLASNIYSGTYIDRNAPGSAERYKFVINTNGGGTTFESPASTSGGDRHFLLGSVAATNPLVLWGDRSQNDVVLVATAVTFQVNMTNAMDRWGVPFNPDTDRMMVDGDFTSPQWQVMGNFDDATIELDHPANIMNRDTDTGLTYSLSFTVPAGSPIQVTYKYGILRNAGGPVYANTNIDNEAGFGQNHLRFIRTLASGSTYQFPLDTFGQQRTDPAGATEPLFGNLSLGRPAGGIFPISWLGVRGVHLQSNTNLVGGVWKDLNATDGTSSTNLPVAPTGQSFFRLVKP
jgi:hypothetical protein